jgi:hypothetical protein
VLGIGSSDVFLAGIAKHGLGCLRGDTEPIMTKHESFKRRVRERMAKTGERYGAARRAILERSEARGGDPARRVRSSEPEVTDAVVLAATGRDWNEWCDLLDAWPAQDRNHTEIAAYLCDEFGLDSWWQQTVTVGYERITGRRAKYQALDGTFSASKAKTVDLDAAALHAMLVDPNEYPSLFPDFDVSLRSRPTTKAPRLAFDTGSSVSEVLFTLFLRPNGRVTITVTHEKLRSSDEVDVWKEHWAAWLETLAGG